MRDQQLSESSATTARHAGAPAPDRNARYERTVMHSHEEAEFMVDIKEAAPEMVSAFFGFDKAVFDKNTGNLDLATRELIAVGVAVTTQCPFCIEDHAERAVKAGASKADIAEAVMVAAALRAGGGVTHGWKAMKSIAENE
ncbi:carboxymuconolactone decarboxylase family protein [Nocardia carnea]|uniref:carboxymuconolactone decarboxylase family protein n=1 Tax=Nocardia carnea TaxID=37328 RepID=UPI00245525D5|nr:carboxymuconolactone decarboxylase family protein [Nocardia carnea]